MKTKNYLSGLYVPNSKKLIEGPRKKAFLGLIVVMQSFLEMFDMYVVSGKLEYFLTYKFSQDHLETFFSSILFSGQ